MQPIIEIEKLKFHYPGQEPTLQISSFKMQVGEKIFLAGPSGSGKTTFLELVAGLLDPSEGKLQVLSQNFAKLNSGDKDEVRKREMSFIFQNFNLVPYLSVEENILLPFWLGFSDSRSEAEVKESLNKLSSDLRIGELRHKKATDLSVGQSQRVAAARAFLKKPKLLLADEPTSALDWDHRNAFLKTLFEIAGEMETSIIFVSHDRSLQAQFDRVQEIGDWK
jgi:putative ABC transport system ATP-binding protein